jgi:hypothetical protein
MLFHPSQKEGYILLIIGEKINSSISAVASAFAKNDKWFIQQLAIAQIEAGANSLD